MTINNLLDLHTDLLLITPTYNTATGLSLITNNEDSHDKARRLLSTLIKSRTVLKRVSLHYYNKKRPSISDSLFSYINEKTKLFFNLKQSFFQFRINFNFINRDFH